MAEAIARPLLGKLQELALNEAKAIVKVKDDIRRLQDRLLWLQAFLLEADPIRRVDGSMLTGVLVTQTRAVALDSEDAIDRYLELYDNIPYRRVWWRRVLKHMERLAQQFLVRHCLSRELTILNERIEQILHSREKYKLGDLRSSGSEGSDLEPQSRWTLPALHVPPYPNTQTERFEGRFCDLKGDTSTLKRHLLNKQSFVVFVCGDISGVGKTALMRSARDKDGKIKKLFAVYWIDLPPGTTSDIIRSSIEKCVGVGDGGTDNHSCSAGRLVVIDCNNMSITCQSVKNWWPSAKEGDKIVLITNRVPPALLSERFEKRGKERCNMKMKLSCLQKNDVWKLFYYKLTGVIIENNEKKGSSQEGMGERVLIQNWRKRRKGVFGLRKCTRSPMQISKSSKETRLQRILLLSFNALPNDLKSCFLYFAGFLPEMKICTQELVRLWVAEGFLSSKDGKSMEIVGHGYLMELIARGLVQVVTRDDSGFVEFVAIASYVHSFLSVEARESSFLDVQFLNRAPDAATVRRLSIPDNQTESSAFNRKYPKLRSLISMEKDNNYMVAASPPGGRMEHVTLPPSSINKDQKKDGAGAATPDSRIQQPRHDREILKVLAGSPYLRVISLQGHNVGIKTLTSASNKVHLRYLRVTKSENLTTVPESIGNLQRLQTLDLRGTYIRQLPDEFWKIETLRHVLGDSIRFPGPTSDSNVRNLQTLETMGPTDPSDDKIMSKMLNLGALAVAGLHVSHDIFIALSKLINLRRLRLEAANINVGSMGLGHHNLQIMELTGNLKIPEDFNFMKISSFFSLSLLKLKNTSVKQDFINGIGHLPNLTHLLLLENSCDLKELEIPQGSFKYLSVLKISGLDKLEKIVANSDMRETFTYCGKVKVVGNYASQFQTPECTCSGEQL
ncbi:unnamed protein product [Urochloa decumbens]|uniref:NB-ARC domain-containing protein n=1 Tax=Urochloa decumbens TaxID=240449 RepID=A0ABC9AVJ1_9POAL